MAGQAGQAEQWKASVDATCALVRSFATAEIDVAVDDVLLPTDAEDVWRPLLNGLATRLVVILPSLDETLARGCRRDEHVPAHLVRSQHDRSARWPRARRPDTTGQTVGGPASRHQIEMLGPPPTSANVRHTASRDEPTSDEP